MKLEKNIVSLREKVAYGTGDLASCLFFKVFASFLVFFYTDIALVPAAAITIMLIVTRIFDAANDPIMGVVCDRTKSIHGKFRPWLRWMIIPYAASGVLIFTVPDIGFPGKLVYVYVTYSLAMVFYTAINIPYGALMGVMTPHSNERTALSTFRFFGAYGGNFVVQGSILYLVIWFGGNRDGATATQSGYVYTMLVYAVLAAALWMFVFYNTKERVQIPNGQESNLKQDIVQLAKNKPWLAVVAIGVSTIIWMALRDASILYYFKYYVVGQIEDGSRFAKLATLFNLIGTVGTLIGVALTNWFAKVFGGKKYAYLLLTVMVAVIGSLYYFSGPGDVWLIFSIQGVTSLLMGPLMPLFWAMIADTADYNEWKFGRRFTGLIFSAGTFSQKLGWALGPAIATWLLSAFGYVANVEQSQETIEGLRAMMSWIPSLIAFVAAAIVMSYGINRKLEVQIENELTDRKAADGSLIV